MSRPINLIAVFLVLVATIIAMAVLWPKPQPPHAHETLNTPQHSGYVLVYFTKNRGSESVLAPVERKIPEKQSSDDTETLHFALEALLHGPTPKETAAGYFSEIPAGTRLLSITAMPKGIVINLSNAYRSGGGSTSMTQRLNQVALTALNNHPKHPLYLQVEGQALDVLGGEGIMVPQPLSKKGLPTL